VRRPPASGCEGARPGSAAEPQPNHASGRRWTASPANVQIIYHRLECGRECALFMNDYSCANTISLNKLRVKQKEAIRAICNAGYRDHTAPLFAQLKILPLDQLITVCVIF
jgi:hypothetical protein